MIMPGDIIREDLDVVIRLSDPSLEYLYYLPDGTPIYAAFPFPPYTKILVREKEKYEELTDGYSSYGYLAH